jgi:hypothetical protein
MYNQIIKYEDTGRFDFVSAAAFIHIGWQVR